MHPTTTWPLITCESVYHIGNLNVAEKGVRGSSYEGNGLSVSVNPDAWEEIAELGGLPWWRLERSGASFLDFHALSAAQRNAIMDWGQTQGLVEPATIWRIEFEDDELESTMMRYFANEAEAQAEATYLDAAPPITEPGWKCTEKLLLRMNWTDALAEAVDGVAMAYAEDVLDVDGVWWDDKLAPEILSAPRGVIFPHRLTLWHRSELAVPSLDVGNF